MCGSLTALCDDLQSFNGAFLAAALKNNYQVAALFTVVFYFKAELLSFKSKVPLGEETVKTALRGSASAACQQHHITPA